MPNSQPAKTSMQALMPSIIRPSLGSAASSGRTKIVATVGPSSDRPEILQALITAGVDVFRLNLSHGTVDEHLARLAAIRAASAEVGREVAVLADLPGPKVRSGRFPDAGVAIVPGQRLQMRPGDLASSDNTIFVEYESLLDDLRAGDRVALGDGDITLLVLSVSNEFAEVEVRTGGRLRGRPGVHLPGERLRLTTPTDEDLELLKVMIPAGIDFAAVSFVRSAADVQKVRDVAGVNGPALVAKIETRAAVEDLAAIIEVADAVMVARGDLGIDCALEDVPHLQKKIIRACVEAGVPVITATQMLESMITSPAPTRAEVSDVANAVFDGTDAVMLSGETAIGDHPVTVIETMSRILVHAEKEASYRQWGSRLGRVQRQRDTAGELRVTQAMTHAAWQAAEDVGVRVIICCTTSGRTARAMARFRPLATLVGASPDPTVVRRLALSWGVVPMQVEFYDSTDALVWHTVERVVHDGLAIASDYVMVLAGDPTSGYGSTDVLRIVRVR